MDALSEAALPLLLHNSQAVPRGGLQTGRHQAQRDVLGQIPHEERHLLQEGSPKEMPLLGTEPDCCHHISMKADTMNVSKPLTAMHGIYIEFLPFE